MARALATRSSPSLRRVTPGRPPRRAPRRRQAPGPAGRSFWEHVLTREEGRCALEDLVLHLQHAIRTAQAHELCPLLGRQTFAPAFIDVRLFEPVYSAWSEMPRSAARFLSRFS